MKKEKITSEEKLKKGRNVKRSRARGVARELRDMGFANVVTSRAESKRMDDMKVDLIDPTGLLPFYAQLKRTSKCPSFFSIEAECPLKDKPFVVF